MSQRLSTTRSETFDLVSCRDVLEKLRREIKRIEDAKDRQDVCDHGTNAAFTAWHMTDWAWADFQNNWAIRTAIAKQVGNDPPKIKLDEFQDYVAKDSEDLGICRVIATASKHVGWDPGVDNLKFTATGIPRSSGKFDATASARSALTITEDPAGPVEIWILKVRIDGQSYEALPIFRNALRYWELFTEKHKIGAPEEARN